MVLLVCGLVAGVWTFWSVNRLDAAIRPPQAEQARIAAELAPPPAEQEETRKRFDYLLLLGDDRRPGEIRARTDTIIIARIDHATGGVVMLSIPRDCRVDVEGHGPSKINAAGNWGGTPLAISTVSSFTGVPIDHYARIDFDGLDSLVNHLGGIQVDVPDAYEVVDRDGNVLEVVPSGRRVLNGQRAVAFVRNRKYPDGDFSRIDNQQQFLLVLSGRLGDESTIARAPQILDALGQHFQTDMSLDYLIALARRTRGSGSGIQSFTVPGHCETIGGASYVIPDEERMRLFVEQLLAGETPAGI